MKVTGTKDTCRSKMITETLQGLMGSLPWKLYAYADSVRWIRHAGEATDQDRLDLDLSGYPLWKELRVKSTLF